MSEEISKAPRSDVQGINMPRQDKDAPEGGPRGKGKRRRKVSYLTVNKIMTVDFKEVNILRRFLNERGKIIASRQSGNTAGQQRMIAEAIRRAREMALLPFVVTEAGPERREYGPRRERYGDRGDRGDRGADRGDRGPRREESAPAAQTPAVTAPAAAPQVAAE